MTDDQFEDRRAVVVALGKRSDRLERKAPTTDLAPTMNAVTVLIEKRAT